MNEVHGQVYADLAVYQLSNGGVGPKQIVLFPTTAKSEYDIYMLFQPFGGQMFSKSESPEHQKLCVTLDAVLDTQSG